MSLNESCSMRFRVFNVVHYTSLSDFEHCSYKCNWSYGNLFCGFFVCFWLKLISSIFFLYFRMIKPKEVILGKGEDPYAVRTLLGWGIIGPVSPLEDIQSDFGEHLVSSCNRILAYEVDTGRCSNRSFVFNSQTKEEINPFAVRRMFERDFSEESIPGSGLSKEDRRFLAIAREGITHLENGHYELPPPLKNPNVVLPNNCESAFRRLLQLKRRFLADGRYHDDYVTFMENMIEKGFAEKVKPGASSSSDTAQQNVWYIPYHGVCHPKKPTKIRVVFNCAAESKGESLNKHLLHGPDLMNTLTGVLNRFRQEHVGIMCDIESMFYQVSVAEEHRDLLRFSGGRMETFRRIQLSTE